MKSTEEYLSILRSEKESLFRKYQISNLGLFGSVARYEQREDSDIDIYLSLIHILRKHVRVLSERRTCFFWTFFSKVYLQILKKYIPLHSLTRELVIC